MGIVDLTDRQAFEAACMQLWREVSAEESPQVIVGIANAGAQVATAIGRFSGLPVVVAERQRGGTYLKRRLRIGVALSRLPRPVADWLRTAESEFRQVIHRLKGRRVTSRPVSFPENPLDHFCERVSNVLLVDDAVDSGATLIDVAEALQEVRHGLRIKTAVLCTTYRTPMRQPDYVLYPDSIVRGPWAMDS